MHVPGLGPCPLLRLLCWPPAAALCAAWAVRRDAWPAGAWALQDLMGVALSLVALRTLRVNLRAACVLLPAALVFQVGAGRLAAEGRHRCNGARGGRSTLQLSRVGAEAPRRAVRRARAGGLGVLRARAVAQQRWATPGGGAWVWRCSLRALRVWAVGLTKAQGSGCRAGLC